MRCDELARRWKLSSAMRWAMCGVAHHSITDGLLLSRLAAFESTAASLRPGNSLEHQDEAKWCCHSQPLDHTATLREDFAVC
jgi:hypothetical protein